MNNLFREKVDLDKYIIATYDLAGTTGLRDACWELAIGQSIGNPSVRNEWESDEMFEKHACKILHLEEELLERKSGVVKIAFPICNTNWKEDGLSHLLVQLMGGQLDIDNITWCRLIDIQFPDIKCIKQVFQRPKYGLNGVRKYTKVNDKPLLGAIIKPKVGLSPKKLLEMVKQLAEAGVNFIKEDEIMANIPCCPLNIRVPIIMNYLKDKSIIYAVCINADSPYLLKRVKQIYKLGGNAVHVNFWCGLGVYRGIRKLVDTFDRPFFVHFQKSGDKILTDRLHRFGIEWSVVCKFAGMCGVDFIHAGMIGGYSDNDPEEMKKVLSILEEYNVVPALSCGMHAGLIKYVWNKVGHFNWMANCGGSIHGHPSGTKAGAKAIRQAIDGNYQEEYKEAIKKWKLKE